MELTKRSFLEKIAKLFDPFGFLAPFLIRAKVLLQEMWAAGLDWDDLFQGDLARRARTWFSELKYLPETKIPRCLRLEQNEELRLEILHTFVDASQDAVVFKRDCYKSGLVPRRLVTAKTRVAPPSTTSIPRSELMAAVLGLKISDSVSKASDSALK